MRGQAHDDVGREVHAVDRAGKVVDDERDRAGVGHRGEVGQDGLAGGGEQGRVVGGRQDQGVVAAGFIGLAAELDGFACALSAAPRDDGHVGEARGVEGLAGGGGDELALGVGEVDGFAVGALGGEAGDAGAGEAHRVVRDGLGVDVLRARLKEAHGRDVDAGDERAVDVLEVGGGRAVGAAEGGVRLHGVKAARHEAGGDDWAVGHAVEASCVAAAGGGCVVVGRHGGGVVR